jgi:membrane-associated protease RseP (regulator of RpoE activity)
MDLYSVSVILFFAMIGVVLYVDRKKIEHSHLVLFMRRTKRFGKFIDDVAKCCPKFWRFFYNIGVIIAILAMVYGLFLISLASYKVISGEITEPALKLVLPSISSQESVGDFSVNIPFWTWVLIIGLILVPHELSHGIAARIDKIKLKSVGLMLLAFFPGAFVEPDDAQLARKKLGTKLRVFCAGTYVNILTALVAILLIAFVVFPVLFQSGVQIIQVDENSPASLAGIPNGTIMIEVNNQPIKTTYVEFIQPYGYFMDEVGIPEIGQELVFKDSNGKTYIVTIDEQDSQPHLGILYTPIPSNNLFYFQLLKFLKKLWVFSSAVAIFNMLPLGPLDGGQVFTSLSEKYIPKYAKRAQKIVFTLTGFLLLVMLFGSTVVGMF